MTKPPLSGRLLAVSLLLLLPLTGCNFPGKPDPAQRPVPADKVLDFATLYEQNCSGCHGAEGKLGPAPPLNDPLFLSIIPATEVLRVIWEGRPGTPMPAFAKERAGPLTDAQVKVLAEGIKTRWGKEVAKLKAEVPPYLAPPSGAAESDSVERGKRVFRMACSVCHGENGFGIEEEGHLSRRINDPAFLALISDQALRRYVITGRPDLGMPNFAGKRPGEPHFEPLTPAAVDDLVALLRSWAPERPGLGTGKGGLPAGPAKGLHSPGSK
jgi:mono/diheme cytochrome c family protein